MKKYSFLRIFLLLAALGLLFRFGCPFYNLLHIPCPCCGVTRAWQAFLRGEFQQALACHALFPLIPVLIVLYCRDALCPAPRKKIESFCALSIASALFAYNLLRWCGVVIMPLTGA